MHRFKKVLGLLCLAMLWSLPKAVRGQNANAQWITGHPVNALWSKLESAPYVRSGDKGMVIYMLTYSSCPNCIAFLNNFYLPRRNQVELREIFAPLSTQPFTNECADVALTRDPSVVDGYYRHTRNAPPFNGSPERTRALEQVQQLFDFVNSEFTKMGHLRGGYPTFFYKVHEGDQDKLFIVSGFGSDFAGELDRQLKNFASAPASMTSGGMSQAPEASEPAVLDSIGLKALSAKLLSRGGLSFVKVGGLTAGMSSPDFTRENIVTGGLVQVHPRGMYHGMRDITLYAYQQVQLIDVKALSSDDHDVLKIIARAPIGGFAPIAFFVPKGDLGKMTEPQLERLIAPVLGLPGERNPHPGPDSDPL